MTSQATPRPVTTAAQQALTTALVDLLDRGRRPVCAGRDEWLSDSADVRAEAAALCLRCWIIAECHEAAEEAGERFGTWAGLDRTRHARGRRDA